MQHKGYNPYYVAYLEIMACHTKLTQFFFSYFTKCNGLYQVWVVFMFCKLGSIFKQAFKNHQFLYF
jgi:hypothetical protein